MEVAPSHSRPDWPGHTHSLPDRQARAGFARAESGPPRALARRSGTRLAWPHRRHTPAAPPHPGDFRRRPLMRTRLLARRHIAWHLLGFPPAAGDRSSDPTASHPIPPCFALGRCGASPTPRATRSFRVAEDARRVGLVAAGPEATTAPRLRPGHGRCILSAGPLFPRRISGWTPLGGSVPLDAPLA